MDIKEIKTHLPLLHSMHKCHGNCERNILMSHMDDKSFQFLCKAMNNSVQNPSTLNLSTSRLRKLRKVLERDKDRLKYLTKPKGSLHRKKLIVKQSGEGIGLLLGVLAPALIEVIRNLVSKRKRKK